MDEFELIRRYFVPLARAEQHADLLLGPGDDAAIQRLPPDTELVFSVDTLVEGVHFPRDYPAELLGWRSLAVATSDLAAMGADPVCFTLALTLPEASPDWLAAFARGLGKAASCFGISLAGGDTTRGALTLSLQVHGAVPAGQALLRNGASPGDLVCVSGTLGDAGEALNWLDHPAPGDNARQLLERYHHPQPRLALGRALRGYASAAIDVSDGLLSDLGHILEASGVGATVDSDAVPLSAPLRALGGEDALAQALVAGDDYELCVTLPPPAWKQLPDAIRGRLTVIGRIVEAPGLEVTGSASGQATGGYNHFGVS